MKRSPIFNLLIFWMMLSLACNFPGLDIQKSEAPVDELRQTLAAISGDVLPTGTPAPGSSQTTPPPLANTAAPGGQGDCVPYAGADQYVYCAASGDTLAGLAGRFDVEINQITSYQALPVPGAFLQPGQQLSIPNKLDETTPNDLLLPDSAVSDSPTSAGFDIQDYVQRAGGYLSAYSELVKSEQMSGAQIIELIAREASINPRFLLAFLEHRSGWVLGRPVSADAYNYPLGFHVAGQKGLYRELIMMVTHTYYGYYGWRTGGFNEIKYTNGARARMSPMLNAGTAGVQNIFAKFYEPDEWQAALFGKDNFLTLYRDMFGDPWARAAQIGPILAPGLQQPVLELPFKAGERWSLTGGPHEAWKTGSPRGALDLAPATGEKECAVSRVWVQAVAPGLVVRSDFNAVALDLDGDGNEQTGWVILYFHIADKERVAAGARVALDDPIGHPSCEGGIVTGTHMHIARKYNGEWLAADGPLPFVMGGWQAYADDRNYYGELRNGERVAVASPVGPATSIVTR